jgi:hypothetical protein
MAVAARRITRVGELETLGFRSDHGGRGQVLRCCGCGGGGGGLCWTSSTPAAQRLSGGAVRRWAVAVLGLMCVPKGSIGDTEDRGNVGGAQSHHEHHDPVKWWWWSGGGGGARRTAARLIRRCAVGAARELGAARRDRAMRVARHITCGWSAGSGRTWQARRVHRVRLEHHLQFPPTPRPPPPPALLPE